MITDRKACEKIIKFLDENTKIRTIPKKRRLMPASVNKIKNMEDLLVQTFSVWPDNAQLIKNPEDLIFLHLMKSDHLATFGSQDKVLTKKVHHQQQSKKAKVTRQKKMKTRSTSCTTFNVNA